MRSLLLAFAIVLCSFSALAQFRSKADPPQNTVREFCRQDFLGGRLSPEGWSRMKTLASWKDNPAWRRFRIASRYEQGEESKGFHSARIAVRYYLLGEFELGIGFTPMTEPDDVEFRLKESADEWRIESITPETFIPHISKARAVQWLQEKLKGTTDPAEKLSIESALKQLQAK